MSQSVGAVELEPTTSRKYMSALRAHNIAALQYFGSYLQVKLETRGLPFVRHRPEAEALTSRVKSLPSAETYRRSVFIEISSPCLSIRDTWDCVVPRRWANCSWVNPAASRAS